MQNLKLENGTQTPPPMFLVGIAPITIEIGGYTGKDIRNSLHVTNM